MLHDWLPDFKPFLGLTLFGNINKDIFVKNKQN